jgi:hypothetical protein
MGFAPRHVPGALKLSQELAWPYRREDWEFAAKVGEGLVLERAGEVIGTALWWKFGSGFATAGMIIVKASARGGGNGARLFDGLLAGTAGRNVLLNSTDEGLVLYQRRGFTPWGVVLQHQGQLIDPVPAEQGDKIRPATASDLLAIQAVDELATGMIRSWMVAALADAGDVLVVERFGQVSGYAIARKFGRGYVVGPVAAETDQDARRLILAHLSRLRGQFVRIDVYAEHGLGDWLDGMGLKRVGQATAMVKGRRPEPDGPAIMYALANQSLG